MANIKKWSVGETEYGKFSISPKGPSSGPFKVYVGRLMPLVGFGVATVGVSPVSAGCLINAGDCKPQYAGSVSTQNFVTLSLYDNRSFALPWLYFGANFIIDVRNKNIHSMKLTTKIDESKLY